MPRLTKKTKGMPEGSDAPGGLAEAGHHAGPSYRTRAKMAGWTHGSCGREGVGRKTTNSSVDADENESLEAEGHGNQMVLVQDPNRVRRVVDNDLILTDCSGHPREDQSTCSYFQDIPLIDKRSGLKICPLQQCYQDARRERSLEVPVRCSRTDKDAEQGQRIETGKCGTDNCSGANVESVKVQQTPIMTLSIQKINSSDVWITRCVGQQPGQHHQGFADARTSRTSTVLSVAEQDMPMSQVNSIDDMKVSDDRSHAIDSTLPPLPSFRDAFNPPYDMTKGYIDLVVEGKNSFEPSSCRMNKNSPVFPVSSSCTVPMMSVNSVCTVPVLPMSSVCPVPEVSVSTVCTAPFVTSASDCVDDKDTLVLLRNAAFESLSEAREMEPNIYVSYPRAQCRVTTVNGGSREISILNRQDSSLHVNNIVENCIVSDGNDSVINVIHSDFSHTSAHQVNPSNGLVKKVVWTAQKPRFAVTSIVPSGKDSEGFVYSLQNDEIGNNVCARLDVEQTESAVREQEYLYVEANSIAHVDEDLSNDMCHSEADSGMLPLNTMSSNYLAPGRDAILNENESYCTSGGTEDNFGSSCSKRVHCTKGQDVGEVRFLSQGENVSALPPTLADLMPEGDGELNDFTPSDQDYTLLPLWPFSGDEGSNHGSENEKPQVSGNVVKITCNDSTIACPKTTSSEDDNFNVGEINDLLDSLLHDIDKEKQRSHTEIEHPSYESTSEETTEYILRDTSRTRPVVGSAESASCPRPVLAHMEKDPTKDIIVASDTPQYPPKPIPQSLKGNCLIPNHSIVGKVPHTVSFKTVPAFRTSASQNVASAHRLNEQLTTTTTTTTKWVQSQESINYVKILPKSSSNRCNTENQTEMSYHHPSALVSASQTKSSCHVSNKKEMVLPVGETGINITIPKCTPVSIASFVLPKNHDQSTRTVSDHMWPGVKSCPEGENAVLLQATNAPTTVRDELCLNVKNTDITPAITKLSKGPILASATAKLMPLLSSVPLVLLAPVSEQPLMIHSIPESSLVCNKNAPQVSNHGAQVTRKSGRKCCGRNAIRPFAVKSEKIKSATYFPQINTASALGSSSVASSSTIQTVAPSQRSAETKTVADSQKHQPKKKPYSDSIKTRKLLQEDLKALLPDFSDSVLAILDLPPRAVHRGFFYMGEVKALHNQALSIQLEMLYRDHVHYCTSDTCIICVAFFDQKAALSEAKREVHVPEREKTGDKRKKQSRGKGGKSYDCEDEDELLFSSPSPQPLKKKNNKFDECVHKKNFHLSNKKETNEIHFILPEKSSQVWGEARMKRSKSDSNVHKSASIHTEAIREHPRYSFDDSCHPPHCLSLTPSRTSPRHSLSPTLRRWKELAARKEVPQKTRNRTYSLRSDHWASLTRATLADLRLKQKLDRDHLPYSEGPEGGGGGGGGRTMCGSLTQDPIIVDILSFNVGTHDLSGQGKPPQLYVCFMDRKLVYVLNTRKEDVSYSARKVSPTTRSRARAMVKLEQYSGRSPPIQAEAGLHPFILIAVPFDSVLSFNITSKTVLVVVGALPSICLMTQKEGCWLNLPRNYSVSPACQSHLALTKALLAVFPMHQLVLQERQSEALQRSLAKSSVWFRQMLERSSPVQGNHIPSWALPSPAVPCDPSPTCSLTSTTLPSSPSCTSTLTSSFTLASTSTGMRSATSPSTFMTISEAEWCSEKTQQGTSQQLQTLSPFVCGAGPPASLSCSSAPTTEAPVVSAVKNVLRDKWSLHALPISRPLQYPSNLSQEEGCSCKGLCRTRECPCAQAGDVCRPNLSCFCQDCDNPLNVLHTFGLDVCMVHRDKCLLQNIYNYNLAGLCTLLVSPVVLPCCGASLELFHILPGTVACMVCTTPVSYSWCSHHIHLQSLCPRNHCTKCWCCKPVFHTHCQRCEQCTRSVLQGQCAECGTESK